MIITLKRDKLQFTDCNFKGETFVKLSQTPDFKEFSGGSFFASPTETNIEYFIEQFPQARWDSEAEILKYKLLASKREIEALRNKPLSQEYYDKVFKTKPFNHQLEAFKLSKDSKAFAYFFEQGCGKTKVTIDNAAYLYLKGKIDAFIIVAPNGVHTNWINDELPIHCKVDYEAFYWDGKTTKKKMQEFEDVCNNEKMKVFSFNIESFVSDKSKNKINYLLDNFRCLFIIDESQTIKNSSAKRTKFLTKLKSDYKRILSGTPVTKGMEDLFSQLQFLNPNIVGLTNEYAFRARYCDMRKVVVPTKSDNPFDKPRSFNKIVGYKNVEELQEKLDKYSYRVLKNECLDLPPKLYQREYYTLTPEQIEMEREIREQGITYIRECKQKGEPIVYEDVLSRLTKRQQILSGYLLNTNEKNIIEIVPRDKNPRLLKLKELLHNINGKVIIWARFDQDINYILDMLGDEAVRYDGHVTTEQKEINKKRFQTDDSIHYFVAKPIRGLTLTAAGTAIYYSNSFDLELRQQSEDRNHRSGSEKLGVKNILYIDIQAHNSIDGQIITSLRNKKKISDMVLKDPESLFLQ